LTKSVKLYEIPLLVRVIHATDAKILANRTFIDHKGEGVLVKYNSDANLRDIDVLMKRPIFPKKAVFFVDAPRAEDAIAICKEKCAGMKIGTKTKAVKIDTDPNRWMFELPKCNRPDRRGVDGTVFRKYDSVDFLFSSEMRLGQCCLSPENPLDPGCSINKFHRRFNSQHAWIRPVIITHGETTLKFISYRNVIGESAKAKA